MRTRAALLRAAVDVIAEQGWQGAGARSVTERAGVPLGALNYHFATKEHLFRQAAVTEVTDMFATPARIMRGSETVKGLVDDMVGWSRVADVTATQQVLLLEVMLQSRRDPALAAGLAGALRDYRHQLADALTRVLDTGCDVEEALAGALAALCDGLFLHAMIEPAFPHRGAADAAREVWAAFFEHHRAPVASRGRGNDEPPPTTGATTRPASTHSIT